MGVGDIRLRDHLDYPNVSDFSVSRIRTCSVSYMSTDFEVAAKQAVRAMFGVVLTTQGCFFHLTQSVWKKLQELKLAVAYKTDDAFRHSCGMLNGLSLLPVQKLESLPLSHCRCMYGSIVIQICAVGSKKRIFSAPECVLAVQCQPRSMILVPIESAYASFYLSPIVTIVLPCTVSEIRRLIG